MMRWEGIMLDKLFDDHNNGHSYDLAMRFTGFTFVWPRFEGDYRKKGIEWEKVLRPNSNRVINMT